MIKDKQILGLFLILLLLSLSCSSLDLKYINTDYSFYSACQNYDIISDKDTALEKPTVATTTAKTGSLSNCQWNVIKETPKEVVTPVYTTTCKETTAKNLSKEQNCSTKQTGTTTKTVTEIAKTTDFSKETATKDKPTKIQYCCDIHRTYTEEKGYNIEVDIIPTLSGKEYTEYAWFNSSYYWRMLINCTQIVNTTIPIVLNGSGGIYINGSKQVIWTQCAPTLAVYYNDNNDYLLANDTQDIPYEVEIGNVSHVDNSLWTGYELVLHGSDLHDSTGNWPDGTIIGGVTITEGRIGNAFNCDGGSGTRVEYSEDIHTSTTSYTVEAQYISDHFSGDDVGILAKVSDGGADRYFEIGITAKNYIQGNGVNNWYITYTSEDNNWNTGVWVLTGGNLYFYNNNSLISSTTGQTANSYSNNEPLELCVWHSNDYGIQGLVDEVRIKNNTYTSNERAQIKNNYRNVSGFGMVDTSPEEQPTTTTTTTTSTTSTRPDTTTTTYPDVRPGINPILEMYAIMIPCFAVIFSLASLHFNKSPVPPIIATILWYAASFWTVNIKYIFDFTTAFRPYYVAYGNPEVGALFMALGTITGIYAIAITIKQAAEVGWIGGRKKK